MTCSVPAGLAAGVGRLTFSMTLARRVHHAGGYLGAADINSDRQAHPRPFPLHHSRNRRDRKLVAYPLADPRPAAGADRENTRVQTATIAS